MSDPTDWGACRLGAELLDGTCTVASVASAFIDRIHSLDPALGAFCRLNSRIDEELVQAERRLADGDRSGLVGVPVAIKDNIATRGIVTDAGSRILAGFVPRRDATAVARLRAAGMVVIGKTNLDEFGMGSSTETSTWGPTRNPWDLSRVAGGSSGGSAVAVAARLAPVALGSDTGGSIRQPAAFCGVFGLKPTYGRISRSGLLAYASSLDQIGPLARTTRDLAALLRVMAGPDRADATAATIAPADYVAACERGVTGMRVGIPREYLHPGLDREIAQGVQRAAGVLEAGGARIEEVSLPLTEYAVPAYYVLATAEASSNLARYDGIRFGRREPAQELQSLYRRTRTAGFGAEVRRRILLGTFVLSAGYHDEYYGRAQHVRERLRSELRRVFANGITALLTPTTPTPAFRLGEHNDDPVAMYLADIFTVTANLAGLPSVAVPAGLNAAGLPLSVQLVAPAFAETTLLQASAVLERAFPSLDPPMNQPAPGPTAGGSPAPAGPR